MNHNLICNLFGQVPGYQPPNFGGLIGLMIALFVCTCMNMCSSSCSRKTIQLENTEHTQLNSSTTTSSKDSIFFQANFSEAHKILSDTEEWWNTTWTKRTFTYDSLGNQTVLSEEVYNSEGGSHKNDTTIITQLSTVNSITVHTDTIHDTISISKQIHTTATRTEYKVPWYYKLVAVAGIAIFFLLLFVLVKTYMN